MRASPEEREPGAAGDAGAPTTLHVRRARAGDAQSLAWIVERFSPALLVQARYRLGPALVRLHEPADVVQDVWAVALPALPRLEGRGARVTPTLVAFLARTLVLRVNELARRRIRRAATEGAGGRDGSEPGPLDAVAAETRGILSRLAGDEAVERVRRAIEELPEADREVLVLRGLEQLDNRAVAALLDRTPNAVSLRYNRALARLRRSLPGSIFDELPMEEGGDEGAAG